MSEQRTQTGIIITLAIVSLAIGTCHTLAAPNTDLDAAVAEIRYQITAIEHGEADKVEAYDRVITSTEALAKQAPQRAEPLVWKGIALAAQAKHKGIGALANVKEARKLLEASLKIDPTACGGAAFNALGMLYYKVPVWPLAFGSDKTARKYFEKALATSSNLDTNYRFAEFLMKEGENEKALVHLERALAFPDRPGRREEVLKKKEIRELINKLRRQ